MSESARAARPGAFLIIGAQRSGTSLLTRMLNQHPRLGVPPESFFFNTFSPLRRFYGDLRNEPNLVHFVGDVVSTPKIREWSPRPTRDQILERIRDRSVGSVFVALLETWAQSHGKAMWGEKTPHHVFYWSDLTGCLPSAPVIHIVRDGRDVALGLINARFGPKTVYTAALRWRRWMLAIDAIRARLPADRWHQISYEDLLRCPEETLGGICRFLGQEYAPEMQEFYRDTTLYSGYSQEHANLNKPLLTDKVAGWRRQMRARDVALFDATAGEHLRQYGYPVESAPRDISRLEHIYRRWVEHPPRKAVAMMRNSPGHREELQLLGMRARLIARYLVSWNRN